MEDNQYEEHDREIRSNSENFSADQSLLETSTRRSIEDNQRILNRTFLQGPDYARAAALESLNNASMGLGNTNAAGGNLDLLYHNSGTISPRIHDLFQQHLPIGQPSQLQVSAQGVFGMQGAGISWLQRNERTRYESAGMDPLPQSLEARLRSQSETAAYLDVLGQQHFNLQHSGPITNSLLMANPSLANGIRSGQLPSSLLQHQMQPSATDHSRFLASQQAQVSRLLEDYQASNHRMVQASLPAGHSLADSFSHHRGQPVSAFNNMRASNVASESNAAHILDCITTGSVLTPHELRGTVSDFEFAVMAQLKPCKLMREDKVGFYKAHEIGFPGICCRHCNGKPAGSGRYFPGALNLLASGGISAAASKHLLEECDQIPKGVLNGLMTLRYQEDDDSSSSRKTSRRIFFSHIWSCLHPERSHRGSAEPMEGSSRSKNSSVSRHGKKEEFPEDYDTKIPWSKIMENSEIVEATDRQLVPDSVFAAIAQTKPCRVTKADQVGRCKDHEIGAIGLCCKFCLGKPGAYGRYFPSNLGTFAQVEVCKQIVKHVTTKCTACPQEIKNAIIFLKKEDDKHNKRFPSRMVFFRRVWHRLHYGDASEETAAAQEEADNKNDYLSADDIPWDLLLKDSALVSANDKGLIPDSKFAAIAQMDRCLLTEDDRIGYNKDREIGFAGLCCRYCGGRPGFGRYFPNTIRNLEKTSARDTMVSHISLFCQDVPKEVRHALSSLKYIESSLDGSASVKNLSYGSGKVFFRRVWQRLHSDSEPRTDGKPGKLEEKEDGSDSDSELAQEKRKGSRGELLQGKAKRLKKTSTGNSSISSSKKTSTGGSSKSKNLSVKQDNSGMTKLQEAIAIKTNKLHYAAPSSCYTGSGHSILSDIASPAHRRLGTPPNQTGIPVKSST